MPCWLIGTIGLLWTIMGIGCGGQPLALPQASPQNLILPPASADADLRQIEGRSVLIRNATLNDGLGGPVKPNTDVLVQNGVITAIGQALENQGLPEIDASGRFLLPGLITSHTHLQSVPGSVLRTDKLPAIHAQQIMQLRTYLACGFTSVLDPAIGPETAKRLQAAVKSGQPGPEIFILAPFITPAEGYMTSHAMRGEAFAEFWPAVTDDTDIDKLMRSGKSLNPVGAKVAVEDGVVFPNLPLFSDQTMVRIREASQRTQTKLFVHSMTNKEHRLALDLKPYALVHIGLWDEEMADDVLEQIKKEHIYVISTVALHSISNWGWHPTFKDDQWIRQRVPILQWETALHANSAEALSDLTSDIMRPSYVPKTLAQMTASWFVASPEEAAEATRSSANAIKRLEQNGVPWALGADEGNSPAYTTFFHGVASQIELEALETVGIPPDRLIAAATTTPAKMLGVSHRLGTIEVGKQADLIILEDNPLTEGMKAFRTLEWTIAKGHARTPAAWLTK